MRMPSSLSSTITFAGLSRPYLRAVLIGIISVADNRPLTKVCVIFLNSFITDIKYLLTLIPLDYMSEHEAEENIHNSFSPTLELTEFLNERLQTSKQMDELYANEREIPLKLNTKNRSLNTRKVRILDKIVFQAMADLTFFFEAVARHPELQGTFENDIKNLLGVRYKDSQEYAFMFVKLLRSIMVIKDEDSHSQDKEQDSELGRKQDGFRLKLIHILQGIVLDKVKPFLPNVFKNYKSERIVWDDLARAWAWTEMLAYPVEGERGDPGRSFDFDTDKLLSS